MKILKKRFYARDTARVALSLLGKFLVRKIKNKKLIAKIVETEAYYGSKDPASRAYKKTKMCMPMFGEAGKTFVYMVHNNWLLNIVTEKERKAGAVLIRAIEPINFFSDTKGPGKLTRALGITNKQNQIDVTKKESEIIILQGKKKEKFKIASSHRIGVTRDLKKKLRFYIANNKFVSR